MGGSGRTGEKEREGRERRQQEGRERRVVRWRKEKGGNGRIIKFARGE